MAIGNLIGVAGFSVLPLWSAIGLIIVSIALTFIAGLIPAHIAAKKDPVIALRTE
jgi:putative ABC transport system permease protein